MADTPIIVNDNSLPKAIMTALQYVVSAVTALAIGKGWVSADLAAQIAAYVLVSVPALYGIYKSIKHNEEKKAMEPFVPDSVAVKKA